MNMRVVSGLAGRFVEQQREQLAVLEPEQQQPDEREQQCRVRGKPLKEVPWPWPYKATAPLRPDSHGCAKLTRPRQAQGLPDHPACP